MLIFGVSPLFVLNASKCFAFVLLHISCLILLKDSHIFTLTDTHYKPLQENLVATDSSIVQGSRIIIERIVMDQKFLVTKIETTDENLIRGQVEHSTHGKIWITLADPENEKYYFTTVSRDVTFFNLLVFTSNV